jgi:hypothetical protein
MKLHLLEVGLMSEKTKDTNEVAVAGPVSVPIKDPSTPTTMKGCVNYGR